MRNKRRIFLYFIVFGWYAVVLSTSSFLTEDSRQGLGRRLWHAKCRLPVGACRQRMQAIIKKKYACTVVCRPSFFKKCCLRYPMLYVLLMSSTCIYTVWSINVHPSRQLNFHDFHAAWLTDGGGLFYVTDMKCDVCSKSMSMSTKSVTFVRKCIYTRAYK